jgi:hypothetical protein
MAELKGRTDVEISIPLIRHMIINALRSYKAKFGKEFGEIIIACDNKKYWRKQLFPHYKANRKKVREDSGLDWHTIFEAVNQIKQELAENFPYPVIEVETAEADDIIASLVLWSQENDLIQKGLEYVPRPVIILSGDHDFAQLQRYPNVQQYSPSFKKWITVEENVDHVLMEHILSGDKGDGVPNFLSPDNVFVSGGRQSPIRKKNLEEWKKLPIEHWDTTIHAANIRRNSQMVDLRLIPNDIKTAIINNYVLQKDVRNKNHLLNYFITHRMKNLMDHITEF